MDDRVQCLPCSARDAHHSQPPLKPVLTKVFRINPIEKSGEMRILECVRCTLEELRSARSRRLQLTGLEPSAADPAHVSAELRMAKLHGDTRPHVSGQAFCLPLFEVLNLSLFVKKRQAALSPETWGRASPCSFAMCSLADTCAGSAAEGSKPVSWSRLERAERNYSVSNTPAKTSKSCDAQDSFLAL